MADLAKQKTIDFDFVADLYDNYVHTDFDVSFWKEEAFAVEGDVLELMCGTGRIGLPLIQAGIAYAGLDYSAGLLDRFRRKLDQKKRKATLLQADARHFHIAQHFDLIFIGFHSLSEVIDNQEKLAVLRQVRHHLNPNGRFVFSLQNPERRAEHLNGQRSEPQVFSLDDQERQLAFSWRFSPPTPNGLVQGTQFYSIRDKSGAVLEERELPIRFHLIPQDQTESLLAEAGFEVLDFWGDYDRSSFTTESNYLIYRCISKA